MFSLFMVSFNLVGYFCFVEFLYFYVVRFIYLFLSGCGLYRVHVPNYCPLLPPVLLGSVRLKETYMLGLPQLMAFIVKIHRE